MHSRDRKRFQRLRAQQRHTTHTGTSEHMCTHEHAQGVVCSKGKGTCSLADFLRCIAPQDRSRAADTASTPRARIFCCEFQLGVSCCFKCAARVLGVFKTLYAK